MNHNFQSQIEKKADSELIDIFINSDEYQAEFVELMVQELDKRGVDLTSYRLKKQHKDEYLLKQLEKGRPGNPAYITLGFISALLGGLLGIIAGYIYSQSKNKESDDDKLYVYDQKTRNLGTGMMVLGIIVMILTIVFKFTD